FAEFEEKYEEKNQLGKGGCGSVFAGCRRADNLPVAIKHIPKDKVFCKHKDKNGRQISVEVAVMLKLESSTASSVGHSAPVSLLDWYDLQQELILVLERPMPAEDLAHYIEEHGGSLQEDEAKIIIQQLVDAAVHLKQNNIFHRDIKVENILIETGSDVPRLRLIDFGLSCINKKTSKYRTFYGTSAHVPPEWLNSCTYSAGPTTVWQVGVVLFEMLHNKEFRSTNFIRKNLRISSTLSQDHCRPSTCSQDEIIIQQLVNAAVHLKQNNIFHRDIKVENILIETGSDVPRLCLIDFGLSCINKKTSKYRTFYGTSAHVPPEWLSSCRYSAGPTTVWQVGVVLFEMLHNKEFRSTNFIRKKLKISSTLSQDCLDFLEQCLTKVPKQRPTLEQLPNHTWFT
ncbi:serine/threonine-protein kinase pim-1-like, partial [Leuresthes tenuis]|uniref:serine/threonine-protein kinase pim-1-like n=1 Tax=Leuresthes tenuis TaxID=355514 RepID=UPI003B4FF9CB